MAARRAAAAAAQIAKLESGVVNGVPVSSYIEEPDGAVKIADHSCVARFRDRRFSGRRVSGTDRPIVSNADACTGVWRDCLLPGERKAHNDYIAESSVSSKNPCRL